MSFEDLIGTTQQRPASDHVPEAAFGNTERGELIARLRSTAYQDDEVRAHAREAADMLEADAASQARERHTRATLNKVLAGLNEAQQVAVPIAVLDAISRAGFMLVKTQSGYKLLPTSRIEAQGAKP